MNHSLAQLAEICGGRLVGAPDMVIDGVTNLRDADQSKISLYTDRHYAQELKHTRAGAVITTETLADDVTGNKLIADNPLLALARVLESFRLGAPRAQSGTVSSTASLSATAQLGAGASVADHAVIGDRAVLGERVEIGPGAVIGAGTEIGADSRIDANVTVYHDCRIGKRCHISAGTVIGSDGFGFAETRGEDGSQWVAIPQVSSVVIGDDVHIGANTCIDRGSLEDTVIGDGVIIDNLVQIAHNVIIGRHTAIAGCAGIAGSARIGENCKIGGRASILGHIEICDDVVVFADSYVTKSIRQPGIYSAAMPAMPLEKWHRILARFRRGAK